MLRNIIDELWIGSMPTPQMVRQCGASAIVSCVKKGTPQEVQNIVKEYSHYAIPDGKRWHGILFEAAIQDVIQWLDNNHTVLVHCHAGRNRSPAVSAVVLIRQYGMTPSEAIDTIRQVRPRALANPVFVDRIMEMQR